MTRYDFMIRTCLDVENKYNLTDEDRKKIMADSLEHCSPTTKHIVAMEELAELQKEISKHARNSGNRFDLLQELADVYICLEYIRMMADISEEEVYKAIDVKLAQERERMRSE